MKKSLETIKKQAIVEAMKDVVKVSKCFDIAIILTISFTVIFSVFKVDFVSTSILFLLLTVENVLLVLAFLYYNYQSFSAVPNLIVSIILASLQFILLGIISANFLKNQTINSLILIFLALIAARRYLLSLFFQKRST